MLCGEIVVVERNVVVVIVTIGILIIPSTPSTPREPSAHIVCQCGMGDEFKRMLVVCGV